MNPLFTMPQVSNKTNLDDVVTFTPTLSDNSADIEKMKSLVNTVNDVSVLKDIEIYRRAIGTSNLMFAGTAIAKIYPYKIALVKTLLETAIDYIPVDNVDLINTVFILTDINMEALDVVLLTRLMIDSKKLTRPYISPYNTQKSISAMIMAAGDKCNSSYSKLHYCDTKYWSFPLYLLDNAQDNAGDLVRLIPEITVSDVGIARRLKDIV